MKAVERLKKSFETAKIGSQLVYFLNECAWVPKNIQTSPKGAEYNKGYGVSIFPSVEEKFTDLIEATGRAYIDAAEGDKKQRWEGLWVLPKEADIATFQDRLSSGEFKSYKDIVESFTNAHARLTALNLANALIVNNIPATSVGTCVKVQPSTEAYASLRKYHSILPLVTAYGGGNLLDYGSALASIMQGCPILEKSVCEAFVDLVKETAS